MSRVIVKSSVFPAGVEVVWEKLQNLSSLQYVAAPFEPADGRNDLMRIQWRRKEKKSSANGFRCGFQRRMAEF